MRVGFNGLSVKGLARQLLDAISAAGHGPEHCSGLPEVIRGHAGE